MRVLTWWPPTQAHRQFVTGAIAHRGQFILGGILFCGAFVLFLFLIGGLMVRWLLSGDFLPEAFDLEPVVPCSRYE